MIAFREFLAKKNYTKAIRFFEKARELESKSPRLDRYSWITMMDNLSAAYGITGNVDMAIRVLQQGIKRYPEYADFYYLLACAYSEKNDINSAVVNLEKAYQRRGYLFPGRKFFDPLLDKSFTRFKKHEKFLSAVFMKE